MGEGFRLPFLEMGSSKPCLLIRGSTSFIGFYESKN